MYEQSYTVTNKKPIMVIDYITLINEEKIYNTTSTSISKTDKFIFIVDETIKKTIREIPISSILSINYKEDYNYNSNNFYSEYKELY
jgi:hypothetical protein